MHASHRGRTAALSLAAALFCGGWACGAAPQGDAAWQAADLAVFEVEDYREIPYYFGMNRCWMTMKRGEIIHMQD